MVQRSWMMISGQRATYSETTVNEALTAPLPKLVVFSLAVGVCWVGKTIVA